MKIVLTNQKGSFDITELVTTAQWSGSCTQCARTLSFGLLDEGAPDCALGCHIMMQEGGGNIFAGIVLTRTKSTASRIIDLTAFDSGIYLNRNQTSKKYICMIPEAATAALAGEFGIPVGTLAATGAPVTRKFFGKTLYEIIMSMYTVAAETTGKKYFVSFTGTTLNVLEKGAAGEILLVTGGSNLVDASTTENAQQLVNRVAVYDADENPLYVKDDAQSAALYGVMQTVIKQKKDEDAMAQVAELLKAAQPEQTISVNCLGNTSCVSGGSVMMQEPSTGLCGRFYIDSDTHQWKNGVYTNKLTLNLKAVMDEKTAGEEIKESASAAKSLKVDDAEFEKRLNEVQTEKGT